MEEMFSDRLKRTMKERGYTQKEPAERSHLTEAAISKYLSGYRTPHLEILAGLASVLNVTTDYLLGVENKSKAESYQLVYEMVERNISSMSAEEKMRLIALITR